MWGCYFASFGLIHCNFTMRFQKIIFVSDSFIGKKMKKFFMILFVMVMGCFAQFVKVFEQPISAGELQVNVYTYAYDAENLIQFNGGTYYAFRSGDELNVLNIHTQQIEFNVKIASLGLGAKCAVWFYFYKNFLKSDGAWTCLVQEYGDSSYYTLKIYTNGFLSNSNIRSYGELIQVRSVEGNLYLTAKTKDAVTIYLVRNDLSSISSANSSPPITALKNSMLKKLAYVSFGSLNLS